MMSSNWIIFGFIYILHLGECQFSDNTPPVMWLDRNWRIPDNEPVGTVVTRVHAEDNERDGLVFGLEPLPYGLNAPAPAPGQHPAKQIQLPFRIDNTTGVVYLNESLKDRSGQNMFLYVTVSDGKLTAKSEVWVNIINGSAQSLSPSSGGSRIRPPFLQLPPGFSNRVPVQPPPSLAPSRDERPPPEHPLGTPVPHRPINKTYLLPVNYPPTPVGNDLAETSTIHQFAESTKRTTIDDFNSIESNVTGVFAADLPVQSTPELTLTLIPVLSVCAIFITLGLLAFIFRKKIYFGRSKTTKEDMVKESNGGIVLQEDPSLAMQNWRGPRAFSNRYEPWDREGNHNIAEDDEQMQTNVNAKLGDRWEIPRHRLKIFNILGEGAFGQVWKCEALDIAGNEGTTVVAVKTLKENASERERSDLLSELEVMKSLGPHPNVVRLLGCCTEREPVFVIMEFIEKGRLQTFLRESRAERHNYGNTHGKSGSLTGRDLTSFVHQVARGMQYLVEKGIIHRDLAARNILITEDHTCKVADFGFARDVTNNTERVYERKSEGRLPIRWMAPESLYDNVFTSKSDVWSFGVLMWEVVTLGSTPYPGLSAADVMRKVRDGHRLDKPEHCRRELYNIMYYCWDKDPDARPTFTECAELLEKLLLTETDYIELERFPDHSYYNMVSLSGEKL